MNSPQTKKRSLKDLHVEQEDEIKWEARFFWPEDQIITLSLLDDSLLDLAQYQQKQKKDHYYLLPDYHYNVKSRRDELLYKPLMKEGKYAQGFGSKINLSELKQHDLPDLELNHQIQQLRASLGYSNEVVVKKDSFTYRFSTQPAVKLELARIVINTRIYFSACIEGKSRPLVEAISKHLLGKKPSCDYVRFLKTTIKKQ